mgnify:CR=1 FL=1
MVEAVKKYSGVDFNDWQTDADAIAAAKAHNVELPEVPTTGAIQAEFFDAYVEDKLITIWSCPKFRPSVRSLQSS